MPTRTLLLLLFLTRLSSAQPCPGFTVATYPAAGKSTFVAIADFNNDSQPDLAVTNWATNNVSVLLNLGQGIFGSPTHFAASSNPHGVTAGDLDSDGNQDLVVANFTANNVSILFGDGLGGFTAATNVTVGIGPDDVTIHDLNGDAKSDLVVVNRNSGVVSDVSVLLGDGLGGFGAQKKYSVGKQPRSVAVEDFNGDGTPDISVANWGLKGDVSVLLGDGLGGFGQSTTYQAGTGPEHIAAADLNADGNVDLAVANENSHEVSVLLGDGQGNFGQAANFAAGSHPHSVVAADFDGDGNRDITTANYGTNDVSILLGDGHGGFGSQLSVSVGIGPFSLATDDLDLDWTPDLAVVNYTAGTVSVLLNKCQPTLYVPGDFLTIQQAITNAPPGATIFVLPGTYAEAIDYLGKSITIEGLSGPTVTILDASGIGTSVVSILGGDGVFDGFTVRGGTGTRKAYGYFGIPFAFYGGGVFVMNSSPTIRNCIIENHTLSSRVPSFGAGIYCSGSSPTIEACTIRNNLAGLGGGICLEGGDFTNAVVRDCLIESNTAQKGGGAASLHVYADEYESCVFRNNRASETGGGLQVERTRFLSAITNCVFSNNEADIGGGVHGIISNIWLTNCTFWGNRAFGSFYGGFEYQPPLLSQKNPMITNCVFWENRPYQLGVPLQVWLVGNVSYNCIQDNPITPIPGVVFPITLWHNTFSDPLLVNPIGGDYHISRESPCRDTGTNAASLLPSADFEGDPRIFSTWGIVDMGADEWRP